MGFRNFTTCLNKKSDMQKDNFTVNDEFYIDLADLLMVKGNFLVSIDR